MFESTASSDVSSSLPSNFASLKKAASANGEHLGDVIWWTLSSADVKRSVLETKWLAAGLDKEFLPEPQTPDKAMRLAVKAAGVGAGSQKQGMLIRPTVDNKTSLIYAIVREGHDEAGNYFSSQQALVMLDKSNPTNITISTDNPGNDVAGTIIKEYYRYVDTHTSRDVMTMLTKVLKAWKAVPLRETGGIYWAPRTMSPKLRALQGAVESIGDSMVFLLPVHKTDEATRSLGTAAAGSIEAELGELRDEIAGWLNDTDHVYAATLDRRLVAFDELRAKANLYKGILGVTVEDLDAQLHAMTQSIETMLAPEALEVNPNRGTLKVGVPLGEPMKPVDLMKGLAEHVEARNARICPICRKLVDPEAFKDALSKKEFGITGICQSCQDGFFSRNDGTDCSDCDAPAPAGGHPIVDGKPVCAACRQV